MMGHAQTRVLFTLAALVAVTCVVPSSFSQDTSGGKIKIKTLDDLPRHTYKLEGSVTDLLQSDEQFAAFAKQVRHDVEEDLSKYDIEDDATLQRFYGTLAALDMLEGHYDDALKRTEQIRELENKEALRLMTGQVSKAFVAAKKDSGGEPTDAAFQTAFAKHLAEAVESLPWDVVQDEVKDSKGRAEIFSKKFLLGIVQSRLDPIVAKSGELSADHADGVVAMRQALELYLPLKEQRVAVYQKYIDAHQVAKQDIWPDRTLTLNPDQKLAPVVIGIWDSGVDEPVFEGRLFTNTREKADGRDSDNNGFVDDVHGIAYDVNGLYTTDLIHPLGDVAGRIGEVLKYTKGFTDLQAAIDSPEASDLKRHIAGLDRDAVQGFIEDLGFAGLYCHGTHVAGIAIDGNPFAQILISRITFDYHSIPQPVTVEIAERHAKSYRDAARYFKQHNVRVVNMSWGWSLKEIESGLEANAIGTDPEERAALAGQILGILKQGLIDAMSSTPEILYVSAAGNDDSDVEFDEVIPSSFDLPNLMIVGAVDQAGEPTSFTSFGENVQVYANGFEVESYVPGGQRMKMSGTSMASPNAANLAAKLIALKPELTPKQVIELIKKGADRKTGAHPYLLMNPKRSAELL